MKKNKESREKYLYRIRENNSDSYVKEAYKSTLDISSVGPLIGDFLRKNKILTMSKLMRLSEETWDKEMVVLSSYDFVFEMEKPIYDRYYEEIDQIVARNMDEAVMKYLKQGETKIVVNFVTSGCEYDLKNEKTDLLDVNKICGLKKLYISYTNPLDLSLFKNIIINVIGNDVPSISFLNSNDIMLKAGERSLVLDKSAYDLMNEIIKEHKKNLNENANIKCMQMKLEDKNG